MAGNAVFSGLWDDTKDVNGVAGGHTLQSGRNPLDKKTARVLKRRGMAVVKEALDTVTTSTNITSDIANVRVTGDEAANNLGDPAVLGGSVAIETDTIRSSGTLTADEVLRADEIAQFDTQPSTYPTDAGGNGGGGKSVDKAPPLG